MYSIKFYLVKAPWRNHHQSWKRLLYISMKALWETMKTPWKTPMKARTPPPSSMKGCWESHRFTTKIHEESTPKKRPYLPPSKTSWKHHETPSWKNHHENPCERWNRHGNACMHGSTTATARTKHLHKDKHHGWEPPINNRESTTNNASWEPMRWKHYYDVLSAYIYISMKVTWKHHMEKTMKFPSDHESPTKESSVYEKKTCSRIAMLAGGQESRCAGGTKNRGQVILAIIVGVRQSSQSQLKIYLLVLIVAWHLISPGRRRTYCRRETIVHKKSSRVRSGRRRIRLPSGSRWNAARKK